jgi:alkaline phosphatase D
MVTAENDERGQAERIGATRRRVLEATGVASTAGALSTVLSGSAFAAESDPKPRPEFDYPMALDPPFAHGVASGDPLADRVILWTRLTYETPPEGRVPVRYEMATNPEMTNVVARGTVTTGSERDWTVKVDPTGLSPATTYYYRFSTNDATSIVGRTRTAPVGNVSALRFGVVACSSYWSGFFNAYGRLADRNDLDLIVHCGDYVYDYPDPQEHVRARLDRFDEEYVDFRNWRTLDEIRRRYALYRSDPDLLRAHQQHPFSIIWDNHELDLDDHGLTEADVLRAFWEWTPTRPPKPDGSGEPIAPSNGQVEPIDREYLYRRLPYGTMGDVFCIDVQQWRDPPATREDIYDDGREFLGREQFDWLTDGLVESSRDGTRWRFVVNQKFMAPFRFGNPPRTLPVPYDEITQGRTVFNNNAWDGYPDARRRLFEALREYDVNDNIVVTGDTHLNWCADLIEDPSPPAYEPATSNGTKGSVGVEFAPSSVSRGGADETIRGELEKGTPESEQDDRALQTSAVAGSRALEKAIRGGNNHAQFVEWVEHGYGITHLTAEEATLEFWWAPLQPRTEHQELGAQMRVLRSPIDNHAIREPTPEPTSGERTAPPAPDPFE